MASVSQYYGNKGTSVKDWQKKLNAMGAGLNVDGVWGDKTEAAYQSLVGSSGAGVNSASSGTSVQYVTPNVMSDEQLRQIAGLTGKESYELQLSQLNSQYERDKAELEKKRSRVESDYGDTAAAIESAYDVRRDELSNQALARGMGRSSYALDMQDRSYDQEQAALLVALQDKQRQIEDIDDSLATLSAVLAEGTDKLSRDRLDSIEAMVSKLKYEQSKAVLEAQKYNNDLQLKLAQLQQSSASKSSGSSGSSKSTKSDTQVINEWKRLTDAGKISYFNQNSETLRRNNYQLYQDMKRQYDTLVKQVTNNQNEQYGNGNWSGIYGSGR